MMANYRKKPVVVDAEQFFEHVSPLPFNPKCVCCLDGDRWYVVTIHGQDATIVDGDWIILEPDGEHAYPCKPDIFEATYEIVQEPTDGE